MAEEYERNKKIPAHILERFPTEEACREALFRIRWPDGFECPHCGHRRYYVIPSRGQYGCTRCGRQTALTGGTIMHKSKIPLYKWFLAVALIAADPAISASTIARMVGLTKPTASLLLRKIRRGVAKHQRFLARIAYG